MAIIPIPNQPIDLEATAADACNIGDGKKYCTLYNNGDYLYWQGKQTPCGNDLMCSPKFGTNILLNSDFALTLENWSISGQWYWSTYGASVITTGVAQIYQNVPTMVAGQSYSITFTVVNFSAGTIRCVLGGGTAGTYRSANGTYTETIVAGSADQNIRFDCGGGGFSGSIVDIIFTGDTSCAPSNDQWIVGDKACNIPNGSSSTLYITFTPVENTGYYQFKIHVDGMKAGSVQVYDAANAVYYGTITANGTYTYYGVLTGNEINLVADGSFDGCISEINIYELRRDIQIHLTDINGTILDDISSSITYIKDRLILKYDTQFLPVAGCYRIAIEDLCSLDTSGILTEINSDSGFDSAGSWTFDVSSVVGVPAPDGAMSVSGSKLILVASGASEGAGIAYINKTWATGSNYYLFKIRFETGASAIGMLTVYIGIPNIDSGGLDLYPMPPSTYAINTTYTYNLIARVKSTAGCVYSGVNVHNKLGIVLNGYNTMHVKSFSVKAALLDTNTIPWLSNCFSMVTTHDCAKLVEGWENAPDDNGVYRSGFLFPDTTGTAFRLSQRLRQLKFNPTYPTEGEDYQYSDGSRKNTFMQREKYYDCLYDYIDETALDALTAEAMCGQFQIGGVDYFAKQEDFKPEWNKDGSQRLAQMRMLIRKKISTIFNSKV